MEYVTLSTVFGFRDDRFYKKLKKITKLIKRIDFYDFKFHNLIKSGRSNQEEP